MEGRGKVLKLNLGKKEKRCLPECFFNHFVSFFFFFLFSQCLNQLLKFMVINDNT